MKRQSLEKLVGAFQKDPRLGEVKGLLGRVVDARVLIDLVGGLGMERGLSSPFDGEVTGFDARRRVAHGAG
jgi:hypothetical protein